MDIGVAADDSGMNLDALILAGVDPVVAKKFVLALNHDKPGVTFMELYGRGAIVDDANGPRRALNIEGLDALDIRTLKPNGQPWDFNKRSDRNEARRLIDEKQPQWLIGSPPCTPFSIWNYAMSFKKMSKEKVRAMVEEGQRHLHFVSSLYRKQLAAGRHFLHEHPATALSWKDPMIAALSRHPLVHCVVADQCQYGLTSHVSNKEGKRLPALKPTRFMTSSPQMAAQLSKRCKRDHVHQQLVGGRAAEAAFYPLPLIRAILQGMRDTADAESTSKANAMERQNIVHAIRSSTDSIQLKVDPATEPIVQKSQIRKLTGGVLPISYDNFKPRYLDEYTGEVLPPELIKSAIVEELNYFNDRVWEIDTKDNMYKVSDNIFVRSRWIMSNKGDAIDPDCRARLVACEVNKTGENNDHFYASTPPLEAKKAMFNRYANTARLGKLPLRLSFIDVRKAYFNGIPKRNVYMSLPKELGLPSHFVAKQVRCVYGTRDAGAIWEDCYRNALEDMGFISGVASPCCFVRKTNGLSVVVHGDDFTIIGTDPQLDWFQNELAKNFEIKIRARLGEGCPGDNEVTILNRVVKITPTGLTYEADPRHAELLAQSLGLSSSNSVATPSVKDPTADYEAIKTNEIPQVTGFSDEAGEMREVIEKKTCSLLGAIGTPSCRERVCTRV